MADSADTPVELRQQTPRGVVDVLDAIANAKRINRSELVNAILANYVRDRVHEANVIQNVTRGNPSLPEGRWHRTES